MKAKTIKWLTHLVNDMVNNIVGIEMPDEDLKLNQKDIEELGKCIDWVNSRK